ncbi:hypothetical protein KFL_009830010 [Klebsormidium nitens]|uniref:FAD-binding PCMH-type domain-containing protein n=1 Tax=Klebsormidium nitens TaxID=105231 RepID=A0A1Y1IN49_KLENI|nr:hypothetical protein KFL_009830010 [Klebsormidium nitens]|eukprot:GAQ92335.1 hypothetical protein KFL_009830010 [Klebsormidium nitens]
MAICDSMLIRFLLVAALAAMYQYINQRPQAVLPTRIIGLFPEAKSLATCLGGVAGIQAVLLPGDEGFAAAALGDNRAFASTPAAIVYPKTTQDVQGVVACARASGVRAVPRSGGHSYEGYSVQTGTVLVDLSGLDFFTPGPGDASARVGPGNRLGPLHYKAWTQMGRVFPGGVCPHVGVGGLILGGGIGPLSRTFGLLSDSLTEVEVVLYNSTMFDPGDNGKVVAFQIEWPTYDVIPDVLEAVQAWLRTAPDELNADAILGFGNVQVSGVYVGTLESFEPLFAQSGLTDIPGYQASSRAPFRNSLAVSTRFIDLVLLYGEYTMGLQGSGEITDLLLGPETSATRHPAPSKYKSALISTLLPRAALAVIRDHIARSRDCAYLEIRALGGAIARVSAEATAFPHRSATFSFQWQVSWEQENEEHKAAQTGWLTDFYSALQPYLGTPRAYVNYLDRDLAESSAQYFGSNLERLQKIKLAYDPLDYFRNPQSVQLPG